MHTVYRRIPWCPLLVEVQLWRRMSTTPLTARTGVALARAGRWRVLCEVACPVPRRGDFLPGSYVDAQAARMLYLKRQMIHPPHASLSQSSHPSPPMFGFSTRDETRIFESREGWDDSPFDGPSDLPRMEDR